MRPSVEIIALVAALLSAFGCAGVSSSPIARPSSDEDYTFEVLTAKQEVKDGNSRLYGNAISSTFNDGTLSGHSTIGNYNLEAGPSGGKMSVCAFDGSMKAYGAGVTAKVCLDTGVQAKNGNVEAKVLGVGGKIGKDGVEICLVFCIGINWG